MTQNTVFRNTYVILLVDAVLVAFSYFFSYLLRFNFAVPPATLQLIFANLPLVICLKILVFHFFKLYRGMWRYTSLPDLVRILKASTLGSLLFVVITLFSHGIAGFPRSVFIIDWGVTLILIGGFRVGIRLLFWFDARNVDSRFPYLGFFSTLFMGQHKSKKMVIVGAGDCGEKIFREIHDNPQLGYQVVAFIDDDPQKSNLRIHGVPVFGKTENISTVVKKEGAQEILIAIPSASRNTMRAIVEQCEKTGVKYKTLPSMSELINGKVTVKLMRDVHYKDLLGREPVKLDVDRIGGYLKGATVLVTGAGGSIGSELCRQICGFIPETLILFERAESPLYEIDLELKKNFPSTRIVPLLADIHDPRQLAAAFETYHPQVVFHAAAYKHVPLLEIQPWRAVKNNIVGTRNVIEAAKKYAVERFVFVSTDKAVRPTSVMGASKRVAELMVQGQNGCRRTDTKFMAVRFGNVVGSAGSVVPLFKKQIEEGGPVTVTHPDVIRYFMTIPEACQLILQASAMGKGGETFLLNMGDPVKIDDMARDLIRFCGYEPDTDIPITYVGLRPGEKLFEELITEGEGILPTGHEKILVLKGESCDQRFLNGAINDLSLLAEQYDGDEIKRALQGLLPEYQPETGREMLTGPFESVGQGDRLKAFDRRKEQRLRPMDGAVVIGDNGNSKEFEIKDICFGGLSFCYDRGALTTDFSSLNLKSSKKGIDLSEISCRVVSQTALEDISSAPTKKLDRLGIAFNSLSAHQNDQLAYFIQNYTIAPEARSEQ